MSESVVPRNVVAKFLRLKDGNPIGLVVATKGPSGDVALGWSFTAKQDRQPGRISKTRAWEIALARAERGTSARCPHALIPLVDEIVERASRYFKVPAAAVLKVPL